MRKAICRQSMPVLKPRDPKGGAAASTILRASVLMLWISSMFLIGMCPAVMPSMDHLVMSRLNQMSGALGFQPISVRHAIVAPMGPLTLCHLDAGGAPTSPSRIFIQYSRMPLRSTLLPDCQCRRNH